MKNKKAMALVLAASTSATLVMAKSAITAHADTLSKTSTKPKNMKTYTNKGQVINVTSALRVRKEASTNTQILGYLKNGNRFNIVSKEGNWYKIEFNNGVGYVYGEYVKQLNRNATVTNNSDIIGEGTVVNVDTNLRFRSGPSANDRVLGYFEEGQELNILSETNGWYKINYEGQIGYIDGQYINFKPIVTNAPNNSIEKKSEIGGVVHVQSNLRIRTSATTESAVIGRLYEGNEVRIMGRDNDWYKIDLGNGKTGFVCADYIQTLTSSSGENNISETNNKVITENNNIKKDNNTNLNDVGKTNNVTPVEKSVVKKQEATSNNNVENNTLNNETKVSAKNNNIVPENTFGQVVVPVGLRIRSGATTNSKIVGVLQNGEGFKVIEKVGNWYKISKDGLSGYVFGDCVKLVNSMPQNKVQNNQSTNKQSNAKEQKNNQTVQNNQTVKNDSNTVTTVQNKNAVGKVINIDSNLRVRTAPNTQSSVLGYLLSGQAINITGKDGNWYRIKLDNGSTGYVYSSYIQLTNDVKVNDVHTEIKNDQNSGVISYNNKFGEVININSSLRIRSAANTNSTVVGYLLNGQGVKVLAKAGNWYKINNNGQIGYVDSQYMKLTNKLVNNNVTNPTNNSNNNNNVTKPSNNSNSGNTNNVANKNASFETVFSILKEEVGAPYVWGGSGQYVTSSLLQQLSNEFPGEANQGDYNLPSQYVNHGYRGFDCSGLMDWAFSQVGINIGRTTYQQATAGRAVSLNDVRPGDLLFFKGDVHVGMYIGNGQWIVSPHSHAYVRICNVPWSLIGSARRVLN